MKLLNCLLVLAFLFLVSCNSAARISLDKELQVENYLLKRLNKPPQKSIKLEHPGGAPFDHKKVNRTIRPVRRTKKEDVLRASSIENFGRKDYPFMTIDNSQEQANGMPGFKVAIE